MGVAQDGTVFFYPAMTGDNVHPTGVGVRPNNSGPWILRLPAVAGFATHPTTLDPYFYIDPATGRIFADDLSPDNCDYFSWSDDEGRSWQNSLAGCMETDHQTIFAGRATTLATMGYANVVYRCSFNLVEDGGTSFPALLLISHDVMAEQDPLQPSNPIVVVSNELQGVRVFQSAPAGPMVQLSEWRGEGMNETMERIHSAQLVKIGDRRIGVATTETYWNAKPSVYLIDFTDYAHPKFLAVWHPPGIPDDKGGIFTTHQFQVVGDKLYVSVWHGGVWELNISDPAKPMPIALRVPVHDTHFPVPGGQLQAGSIVVFLDMDGIWDINVVNGYTLITDLPAGVEVLAFNGDPTGSASYNSIQ